MAAVELKLGPEQRYNKFWDLLIGSKQGLGMSWRFGEEDFKFILSCVYIGMY